jgi:hypothetical protein
MPPIYSLSNGPTAWSQSGTSAWFPLVPFRAGCPRGRHEGAARGTSIDGEGPQGEGRGRPILPRSQNVPRLHPEGVPSRQSTGDEDQQSSVV